MVPMNSRAEQEAAEFLAVLLQSQVSERAAGLGRDQVRRVRLLARLAINVMPDRSHAGKLRHRGHGGHRGKLYENHQIELPG
jgi:hypothetical protein